MKHLLRIKELATQHTDGKLTDIAFMMAVTKEMNAHKAASLHRVTIRGLSSRMGCAKPSLGRKPVTVHFN